MGAFITGNTPLPAAKTNKNPPQGFSWEVDASDITDLWNAAGDLRSAVYSTSTVVNVKDPQYAGGAKGDGTTDDSAAITAAATAAATGTGNTLYFPAGTYRCSNNVTTGAGAMLMFAAGAAISADAGKTFTATGRVIALGGDPEVGAGSMVLVNDANLCVNDSGFYFGKLFASGTDSFFVIRRDNPGSNGIIIRNDDITSALTDSYIHLYGGPLTGVNQGSNLRFSAGNLANNGGLCNIVAQHCASFNLLNLDATPVRIHTSGVLQLEVASVASAVNYWQFKGSPAGSSISFAPAGTDTNISIVYNTKGTGSHFFRTGATSAFQLEIKDTAGAANRLTITGGANPTIGASGGSIAVGKALVQTRVVLTYSATIATDASLGNTFSIPVTNGTAFTISDPTNLSTGQRVLYVIRNISGGALGAIAWGTTLFKMPAFTAPATGFSRSVEFMYDGVNLIQLWQSAADVPN